mgnify:CR=1 FL=1
MRRIPLRFFHKGIRDPQSPLEGFPALLNPQVHFLGFFFGVSIDELFGLTSLERAEDLVCKYSVLRDDRSFHEAMECVNSMLQTIDAVRSFRSRVIFSPMVSFINAPPI